MKVQKIAQEQKFTPVELRITIESKEERELLRELFFYNKPVTSEIYYNDRVKQEKLGVMMRGILECL